MIQIKITNEQLIALKADASFTELADTLLAIHSLRTARDRSFKARRDGWMDIDDKYLDFNTLIALNAAHGIEVNEMLVYAEVSTAMLTNDVPNYLPKPTKSVTIGEETTTVNKIWEDLKSRTSLDGTKHVCSFTALLSFGIVQQLINETGVLVMKHSDTLTLIASNYQEAEV